MMLLKIMLLIPGPIGALCVTVDHLQLDLGSVRVIGILDNNQLACWSFRLPGGPQISVREFIRRGTRGPRPQAASTKRQA